MIAMTTKTYTLQDLIEEYEEYSYALLNCDPSSSEYALEEFIEIQQWGEELHTAAREMDITWEQIEDGADV